MYIYIQKRILKRLCREPSPRSLGFWPLPRSVFPPSALNPLELRILVALRGCPVPSPKAMGATNYEDTAV